MRTQQEKKATNKFDLEKMRVAKLKNIHLIDGGISLQIDPYPTTDKLNTYSTRDCGKY